MILRNGVNKVNSSGCIALLEGNLAADGCGAKHQSTFQCEESSCFDPCLGYGSFIACVSGGRELDLQSLRGKWVRLSTCIRHLRRLRQLQGVLHHLQPTLLLHGFPRRGNRRRRGRVARRELGIARVEPIRNQGPARRLRRRMAASATNPTEASASRAERARTEPSAHAQPLVWSAAAGPAAAAPALPIGAASPEAPIPLLPAETGELDPAAPPWPDIPPAPVLGAGPLSVPVAPPAPLGAPSLPLSTPPSVTARTARSPCSSARSPIETSAPERRLRDRPSRSSGRAPSCGSHRSKAPWSRSSARR